MKGVLSFVKNGLKGKESDLGRSLPVQGFVEYPPAKDWGIEKRQERQREEMLGRKKKVGIIHD